jgi:hypothetical protein
MLGKAEHTDFWERSLFRAVAQVNLTALNTLLLLIAFCSFFTSGFIFFLLLCFKPACRLLRVYLLCLKLCSCLDASSLSLCSPMKLVAFQLHTSHETRSQWYFARHGFRQAFGFCFRWYVALPY